MNVLLCNGKGGTGKTTLTVLLAYAMAEAGKKVAVLDRDPQGTATKWIQECDGNKVLLYDHGSEYDAVFIDTPPRLDSLARALASCSIAVIVCSPSPADLWTTKNTVEEIQPHLSNRHGCGFCSMACSLIPFWRGSSQTWRSASA